MMNYDEAYQTLKTKENVRRYHSMMIMDKGIPETDKPGMLDPRVAELTAKPQPPLSENTYTFMGFPIGSFRDMCGCENKPIHKGNITEELIQRDTYKMKMYLPENKQENSPCFIFFHGGGFLAGTIDVVENFCKGIAEKAQCVVVNVDYRLAPETPFPGGLNDCDDAVIWIYDNAFEYGIDPHKIGVGGDSAGGNLALVCAIRDRDRKTNRIAYQALLYPGLDFADIPCPYYEDDDSAFVFDESNVYGREAIKAIPNTKSIFGKIYYQDESHGDNPEISPMFLEDLQGLAKTLIVTAEYDYLKVMCHAFANRMYEANVDVRVINYLGVDHAFIDKCGIYPQAEDACDEIVKDIKAL